MAPKSGFDRAFGSPRTDERLQPQRLDPSALNVGVRLDASALEIPLGAAVKLENCRFEEQGIRKDFGYVGIGGAAVSQVLGLAEHKFIDSGELFHRLVRILRSPSDLAEVYAWDGSSWVFVDDTSANGETIESRPLVMFSTQGRLVMTEGTQILSWSEVPTTTLREHDFPAGNDLNTVGAQADVTVVENEAFDGIYTLHYSVDITGSAEGDKILTLGIYHGSEKLDDVVYVSPAASASDSWAHETFEAFRPSLVDNDVLSIKVEDFETTNSEVRDAFGGGDSTVDFIATKSVTPEAVGDEYVYHYEVTIPASFSGETNEVTIGLYKDSGSGWVQIDTTTFFNSSDTGKTFVREESEIIDNMGNGDKFGLKKEADNTGGGVLVPDEVVYQQGITFSVHGFNKATDLDPAAGETHDERTGTTSTFQELSPDAPKATFIFPFGDRLLALQDTGDPQLLSWSVDGDITDWTGFGSGATSLLDARSDPLDDLMAMGAVASNVAVLFRKRSMMRVQETGNPTLAISAQHWIEGLGTESPLTVKQVRDGLMFLGHDLMVYYFTGSGAPQPVGRPIHREIIEDVSETDLAEVEGVYDPVFGEYWLKLPSRVWVFDLSEFLETRTPKWRSKDIQPQRLATVSRLA